MPKRVCRRDASLSLPGVVLHGLPRMMDNARDVLSLLNALPVAMLPPDLSALRDLGAVVELEEHWPVVHVTKIPIEHARLAIAALPAFSGVYVDAGAAALAWLGATLPPAMPLTLVVDPSVPGTHSAFAYVWGDRVTNVIVKECEFGFDTIPDVLARCVNVQSVTSESPDGAYLAAIPTTHLHTLQVNALALFRGDTSSIVAWLQGPRATSLSLAYASVDDAPTLASAIAGCAHLTSLSLDDSVDVLEALVASPKSLHHITALSVNANGRNSGLALRLLRKLDRTKVLSFSLHLDESEDDMIETDVIDALAVCPALKSLSLSNVLFPTLTATGVWPQLATVTLDGLRFRTPADEIKFIQSLSTSRCLTSVSFWDANLETMALVEMVRVLPRWVARGLTTFRLSGDYPTEADVAVLTVALALAAGRNQQHLTLDLSATTLTLTSVTLLLTTLGACHNVTLHLNKNRLDAAIRALGEQYQLVETSPGVFKSPTRASSPL